MTDKVVARCVVSLRKLFPVLTAFLLLLLTTQASASSEANLVVPDLSQGLFLGMTGSSILTWGILICIFGVAFSLVQFSQIKNLPVHKSMLEISELIYETCKTYLIQQGKFIAILWAFIAVIIVWYFSRSMEAYKVVIIVLSSVVGILGSYSVAWFGIRMNTYANSRTAFAGLQGKPYPTMAIPLKAGMSIGMLLIAVELILMLIILVFIPGELAGPCFIGFAIGESLGAAALRIAVPYTATRTASPTEPPSCCMTLTMLDAAPDSWGRTPASDAVVSGTKTTPIPAPSSAMGPNTPAQ